jgi:thiosulfate/3-mercaptopyruvate sulfurtransferase
MRGLRTVPLLILIAVIVAVAAIILSRVGVKRGPDAVEEWGHLVSTAWLADHLDDADVVALHVGRDSTAYLTGHIPGARFLPIARFVVERDGLPNELPAVDDLVALFESLGISNDSRVVLYGDYRGLWASRVFFTFDYLGLGERTALVNGGLEAWRAEDRPVTSELPVVSAGRLSVTPRPELVVGGEWVYERLGAAGIKLLDARPVEHYRGDESGREIERPGHVPGAVSLHWEETVGSRERPVLLDLETIRRMYRERGIVEGDTIVTYCRTGIQASHAYFVARLLGHPLKLYDASYLEWSNLTDYAVETGMTNDE